MVKKFGFGRKEKLKSRKQIESLFLNGRRFVQFPIRITYQFFATVEEPIVQVGVTAGKKYFKKALDRNRIKRLLREAYRLQKRELLETAKQKKMKVFIFFMYTDKTISSFDVIKEAMNKALIFLQKQLTLPNENPS